MEKKKYRYILIFIGACWLLSIVMTYINPLFFRFIFLVRTFMFVKNIFLYLFIFGAVGFWAVMLFDIAGRNFREGYAKISWFLFQTLLNLKQIHIIGFWIPDFKSWLMK